MGFFFADTDKRSSSKPRTISKESLSVLAARGCDGCTMKKEWRHLDNPQMLPTGVEDPLVYVLGEAPGEEEDYQGRQFVGKAGRILRPAMGDWLLDRARFNNVLNCHPPKNRDPSLLEVACCRGYIEEDILNTNPQVILAAGHFPLKWFLEGKELPDTKVSTWRGSFFPIEIQGKGFWVYTVYHPSWVLRNPGKRNSQAPFDDPNRHILELDLERLEQELRNGMPAPPKIPNKEEAMRGIEVSYGRSEGEVNRILDWMDKLAEGNHAGIDLETQGLRPYNKENPILTVALATHSGGIAFPLHHPQGFKGYKKGFRRSYKRLKEYLYDGPTHIVQNLKFEQEWLSIEYGKDLLRAANWEDTMSMAYSMNHWASKALSSLTFKHFGFNVKALSPKMNMGNLASERLERILPYNGLDAKWTDALFEPMVEALNTPYYESVIPTYEYQVRSAPSLVLAQQEGMHTDEDRRLELSKQFKKDLDEVLHDIETDPAVKRFEKKYNRTFNPASDGKDVPDLFQVVLQRPEGMDKRTNRYSTSEASLKSMPADKVPIAGKILKFRNLSKIKGTYIDAVPGYRYEDGLMHTNYTNTFVVTGRLSSEDPNNQNWPSRRDKYIRSIVVPPKGYKFVAVDYGQIDARNIAMASQDEAYIEELWKGLDTHMKWTEELLAVAPQKLDEMARNYPADKDDEKALVKWFRKDVKNEWTFPLFYGSTLEQASYHLGIPPRDIAPVFDMFWETYRGVKQWQEDLKQFYLDYGYVETLNGRRRYGPMKENEVINSPIQGTTAEVVGDAMNRCSEEAYPPVGRIRTRKVLHDRSKQPMMQIHDDLTFHVRNDAKFKNRMMDIVRIMCAVPFDWVCVPIVVEATVGDNWHEMEAVGEFRSDEVLK